METPCNRTGGNDSAILETFLVEWKPRSTQHHTPRTITLETFLVEWKLR